MQIYQTLTKVAIVKFARGVSNLLLKQSSFLIGVANLQLQGRKVAILDSNSIYLHSFNIKMERAKLIEENVAIIDKLKAQKVKCGKTSQQIAKDCNLSESTVARVLSGKTPNPTIAIVIAMWKAMGGTATELFDDTVKVDVVSEAPQVVVPQVDERLYNEIINIYKDLLKVKDRRITTLLAFLGVLIVALVVVSIL